MRRSGASNSLLLGELAYPALEGREGAVHLLPLGATEPHGPHAPLATDTLISAGICRRAAERLRGEVDVLVLPEVSYGVTRYGSDFPGRVSIGTCSSTATSSRSRSGRLASSPCRCSTSRGGRTPSASRTSSDSARDTRADTRPHSCSPIALTWSTGREWARWKRTWSTCPRRSGPGRRASSQWAWIRRTP